MAPLQNPRNHQFDITTRQGLVTRGAIYLPYLYPTFGYHQKIATINKEECAKQLEFYLPKLITLMQVSPQDIFLDSEKPRLLLGAKKIHLWHSQIKELGLVPAIVKEDPLSNYLEIEVDLFI